jgi:L-seryl-tRNA(Ser) seleniumtransferase
LKIPDDALRARAEAISSSLQGLPATIGIGCGRAKAGGGTLPGSNMPSVTIDIMPRNSSVAEFAATLRASDPPIIGYVTDERFKLDMRTIFPDQDDLVIKAIRAACGGNP